MNRLFKNTVFTGLDYFVLIVLNLLATPILIRNFGVEGYGAFVFLSIFSIYGFMSFFDLGMEGSLMNYIARFETEDDNQKLQNTLSVALAYYAVLGIILGIALRLGGSIIAARLLGDQTTVSLQSVMAALSYISINIVIQFLTLPFTAVLQGLRRFVIAKLINSSMNILRYLLLIITALKYHRIDIAFLVITCLSAVMLLIYVGLFFFKLPQFRGMRPRFDMSILRRLFSYSTILFISRIIGLICNQIDKMVIWWFQAVASMTVYDVVSRPANLLRLVLSVLNSAVIPEAARLHQVNDLTSLRRLFINLVRYAYLILFPIVAALFVFMDYLLRGWIGTQYSQHAYLALILLSVYLILPIPSIASTMVVGLEKVKQTIWISVAYTIIKVVLSLILWRSFGLAGLMLGTLGAELFYLFPYLKAMGKFLAFGWKDIISPVAAITAVAAGAAACHLAIRIMAAQNFVLMAALAAVVCLLHAAINYRFLLHPDERLSLMQKLRLAGNNAADTTVAENQPL